ncbi:hypothetical protein BG841_15860 [Marinobacter sp. X15-166B]|nr:hypothetical protein BG841_15860 [Marinobacter sp. X15-166B]
MKVLHLIDSGGLYGAEKMLLTLVAEQRRQGLAPMILSAGKPGQADKPIETEARRLGLPVTPWRMKPGFNLTGARNIIRWAQEHGYQLLHSHGYKFNVLMGLWPEFVRTIPLITTLHGYVKAPRFSKSWLYESLDRLGLSQMRTVVLVSEAMKQQIPRTIAHSARVTVIPNGLDVEVVRAKAQRPVNDACRRFINHHSPVLLGVGRLSPEKGFACLIQTLAEVRHTYPDAGLIIVGQGGQRERLAFLIGQHGLQEHVLLPGYVDNVPALMSRASLLCMPSTTEGLPITLLEAMAVGVPVVATDVGQIGEVLGGGQGGWIVSPDKVSQLGTDVVTILAHPPRTQAAARWAGMRVARDFSATTMARRYEEVYRQCLALCRREADSTV